MKRLLAILLIMTLALPVYAKKHQTENIITPQTQLEKRKFQTRTYKTKDSTQVMKAILNVLQDDGYIVYNVNSLLGFVYAVKDFDTTDPNIDISKEFGLSKSRLNYNGIKVATIETSANVTQYGDILRVRINFKRKLLNEYGNAQFIDDVSDSEFYDSFYEKLNTVLALHDEINNAEEPKQEETAVNTTTDTSETTVDPQLLKEINDEINKIINSETPAIPEVSVPQAVKAEETPTTETATPAKEEQVKNEEETQTPEVKEEETAPSAEKAEEKPEEKATKSAEEPQKEPAEEITPETNADNSEIKEEKKEITEEKATKKEKKAKNKKNKNSKEDITEETSANTEPDTKEEKTEE